MSIPNKDGSTLLHDMAEIGNLYQIDAELNNGADVNARNKFGQTALHIAYKKGMKEAAVLLIKRGADASIRDNEGKIPFDYNLSC